MGDPRILSFSQYSSGGAAEGRNLTITLASQMKKGRKYRMTHVAGGRQSLDTLVMFARLGGPIDEQLTNLVSDAVMSGYGHVVELPGKGWAGPNDDGLWPEDLTILVNMTTGLLPAVQVVSVGFIFQEMTEESEA